MTKQLLFSFLFFYMFWGAPLQAAEGLSTPFVDVKAMDIPVGTPYAVHDSGGRNLVLRNLGDKMVRVKIEAVKPSDAQLRLGAQSVPDVAWVDIEPVILQIDPHSQAECRITVRVPNERKFRKRLYQVMIWSHGMPAANGGVSVSAGLLSRLQFKTAK